MLRCAKSDTRHDNQLTTFCVQYVAYHDIIRRDLYVSSDEGKNWQRVADIPQGNTALFIEHPFNNRMVSISSTYPPICSAVPRLLFWLWLRAVRRWQEGIPALLTFSSYLFLALESLGLVKSPHIRSCDPTPS